MKPIAYIRTDFPEKYGIPRQSNLIEKLTGEIIFEPEFRNPEAVRGLEGFEYIWLLWRFDVPDRDGFVATVRPPRLGGKDRVGVFATRSPYRPNPIGLSSVRLCGIEQTDDKGVILRVEGVDLRDRTAIYDIKPYISFSDSHSDVRNGFVEENDWKELKVDFPDEYRQDFSPDKLELLLQILAMDPRDAIKRDNEQEFGLAFVNKNIRFYVADGTLHVTEVTDYIREN